MGNIYVAPSVGLSIFITRVRFLESEYMKWKSKNKVQSIFTFRISFALYSIIKNKNVNQNKHSKPS